MSCPVCEGAFKVYGFRLKQGLKCYLAGKKLCCPKKVTIVDFSAKEVKFTSEDGQEHSIPFLDFMKSAWIDKSPI